MGGFLRGFQLSHHQYLHAWNRLVHSRGSGIDHASKTTKKYWCLNSPNGHIIVATAYGQVSYQGGPMSGVSPRPHHRLIVKFVSASNISEAAPVCESRYVCASD